MIALVVLALIFLSLGFIRSDNALIHSFDTGLYLQILTNLSEGRGWASSLTGEHIFLAHHFQPVIALLLPVHLLFSSAFGMLVVSWAFIFASALFLALYLPRNEIASQKSANIIALAFFLHPTITSRMYYSFVPEVMALPALCFLAALLEKKGKLRSKDWVLLLVSMVFASLCKETLWLTTAWASLVFALAYRKTKEVHSFVLLAAVLLGLFCYLFLVWMPAHTSLNSYFGISYYRNEWVDDRWGMAGKILGAALNIFSFESLSTLVIAVLLLPVGLVLFGGYWALLAALPAVVIILASSQSQVQDLTNHYLLGALPFLAVSSAVGLDRVLARFSNDKMKHYFQAFVIAVPLIVTLFHNSGFLFQTLFATARMSPGIREASEQLIKDIDPNDLVLIDGSLQPLFHRLPNVKIILGFQGNPTHLTPDDLVKAKHVITSNDLSELKDCRSFKQGVGDLSVYDYEGFYTFCEWLKKEAFVKTVLVPDRIIHLTRKVK